MPQNRERQLEALAPDLWVTNHPLRFLGFLDIGHRMTLLRIGNEGLLVHSPVALDDALAAELGALGEVRWVVAPSIFHDLYLEPYFERYPEAEFLAAPGLAERRSELPFTGTLGEDAGRFPGDAVGVLPVEGMPRVNERALLHRPSRTLIVADLIFNLREPGGFLSRCFLRMAGIHGENGASRLFRMLIRDRGRFDASLDTLLGLDFDRIVLGHGAVIETGGKAALREAYGRSEDAEVRR